jgi:hypothetical protein
LVRTLVARIFLNTNDAPSPAFGAVPPGSHWPIPSFRADFPTVVSNFVRISPHLQNTAQKASSLQSEDEWAFPVLGG